MTRAVRESLLRKYEALLEDLFSQCPWLKPLEARSPESSVNNAK